jgi:hypothetical protein
VADGGLSRSFPAFAYEDPGCIPVFSFCIRNLFFRSKRKNVNATIAARPRTAATTIPAITPVLILLGFVVGVSDVCADVGDVDGGEPAAMLEAVLKVEVLTDVVVAGEPPADPEVDVFSAALGVDVFSTIFEVDVLAVGLIVLAAGVVLVLHAGSAKTVPK